MKNLNELIQQAELIRSYLEDRLLSQEVTEVEIQD